MHVLLAETSKLLRDALHSYLETARPGIRVTDAGTLGQLCEQLANGGIDLVLIDLNLRGMNGLSGISSLHRRAPALPIVVLAEGSDRAAAGRALRNGAAGFVHKGLSGRVMLKALEIVLSGRIYAPVASLAAATRPAAAPAATPGCSFDRLTRRERDVLDLLVKGHSNRQIADQLRIKNITVSFHLKGLFRKLNAANRTQAAITAVRLGWAA